jgi:hypothetical protein
LHSVPWKERGRYNWVLGAAGGGSISNPVRARRSPAGGEQGRGLGSTMVQFVGLVGEEGLPTGVDSGTRRQSPLEPLLWRASGRGKATGGAGSS